MRDAVAGDTSRSASRWEQPEWYRSLSKYEKPHRWKAIWQLVDTLVPYFALWAIAVWILNHGYSIWLTLPFDLVAAGLLVRVFIFFHDCGHSSFFDSRRANRIVGFITGVLTFTPYEDWRQPHIVHHSTSGNLDRRGTGDIWTLTVDEFRTASRRQQLTYRVYRNPIVLFVITPVILFAIAQRFPRRGSGQAERRSVWLTDLAILGIVALASMTIGLRSYLLIQTPIIGIAGAIGMWLFYVQHQFEGVSWARNPSWDPIRTALNDSSYYRLPKVLQWFTGNIGLHHIHHLRPRIPNYNLQRCYDEIPALQEVRPLTFWRSLRSLVLNLWDEREQKMVSFRAIR